MAMTATQLGWIAGMVEGEGCITKNAKITVCSSDLDVLDKIASLWRTTVQPVKNYSQLSKKPMYRVAVGGKHGAGWLMTIWSLLGERRRTKAKEIIKHWLLLLPAPQDRTQCPSGHLYTLASTVRTRFGRGCRTCNNEARRLKRRAV